MSHRLRIWPLVLLLSGLVLAALSYWSRSTRPRTTLDRLSIESLGHPLVRVLSLAQVDNGEPFTARVEYKNPEPNLLTVYLRKADGTQLAIRERVTNTSHVIFLESLEIGKTYRFPLPHRATAPSK